VKAINHLIAMKKKGLN